MKKSNKWILILSIIVLIAATGTYFYLKSRTICKKPFVTDLNNSYKFKGQGHFLAFDFIEKNNHIKGSFILTTENQPKGILNNFIAEKNDDNTYNLTICIDDQEFEGTFTGIFTNQNIKGIFKPEQELIAHLQLNLKEYQFNIHKKIQLKPQPSKRYQEQVFDSVRVRTDIHFGNAKGYYSEYIVDKNSEPDYSEVIKTVLKKLSKKSLNSFMSVFSKRFDEYQNHDLYMDIYEPFGDTLKQRPLLLMIHGGAFLIGEKRTETIKYLANRKAKEGYVVASIDYRMGFNPASPSSMERSAYRAVQDARAAMRYLVHYAKHFQIDTSEIYVGGTSAGSITALNLAYMDADQKFESTDGAWWRFQEDLGCLDCSTNDYKEDFSIKGVINMWGAVHDTSIIDQQDQIPLISFHGNSDRIVPIDHNYPFVNLDTAYTQYVLNKLYGSRPVHEQLSKYGIQNELHEFEGKDHEPQLGNETYFDEKVIKFISKESKIFLYELLLPKVSISDVSQGFNEIASYKAPFYPNANYHWSIENGVILNQNSNQNSIEVIWFEGKRKGKIDLILTTAVGAQNQTEMIQKLN